MGDLVSFRTARVLRDSCREAEELGAFHDELVEACWSWAAEGIDVEKMLDRCAMIVAGTKAAWAKFKRGSA